MEDNATHSVSLDDRFNHFSTSRSAGPILTGLTGHQDAPACAATAIPDRISLSGEPGADPRKGGGDASFPQNALFASPKFDSSPQATETPELKTLRIITSPIRDRCVSRPALPCPYTGAHIVKKAFQMRPPISNHRSNQQKQRSLDHHE